MNVNCVNITLVGGRGGGGEGEQSLNITNISLLIRFDKTREILPSVTRVLSILQTVSAASASVE